MNTKYVPPKKLREWMNDVPNGNLYSLFVLDNGSVWSASGRHAHDSAAMSCAWQEFLDGKIDAPVLKTMGPDVLSGAKAYVATLS